MSHAFNTLDQVTAVPPKDDSRIRRITTEINRHHKRPDALIEVLHVVQDLYGYIPLNLMTFVSREMKVPPSRVYGVATFYHFFSLRPKGEHNCIICMGTACFVKGARNVLEKIETDFQVQPGETTQDGKLGLQTARCFGCCGMAPVVVLDTDILAKVTPENIVGTLQEKIGNNK
ncbi:MAG: bidirectional hydrogenase complex protein HoxE [Candidatus Omnitrophica bacterium]|nr:bidirectional hydrogenase complex protein HoxE [Candidatus Omnitrophota bacterium]